MRLSRHYCPGCQSETIHEGLQCVHGHNSVIVAALIPRLVDTGREYMRLEHMRQLHAFTNKKKKLILETVAA